MSEFDSRVNDAMDREAAYVGSRMDENREAQWSAKRRDDESFRSDLERDTESLDDPPEKISLDEKPYDRFGRHADIRDDLSKAVDVSFYNSANAEKRERYISEFDLIDKHVQRSHGVDGVTGLKQMLQIDEGIRSPDFQTRVATVQHLVNLAHNDSDYGPAAQQRAYDNTMKVIAAVENKYDVAPQIWDHVADYMNTPAFQSSKTGDHEADLLMAIRRVKEGLKRVKFA
jgi:hypothetical protein